LKRLIIKEFSKTQSTNKIDEKNSDYRTEKNFNWVQNLARHDITYTIRNQSLF